MALRFKSSGTAQEIPLAGSSIPHGLGQTPDEVFFIQTNVAGIAYEFSAADASNIYLAAFSAACSARGYAAKNHPWMA
jgi:hypothetical protein